MTTQIIIWSLLLLLNLKLGAQEKLISETDSIAIFETYISLNSTENIAPIIYNDGLIYASANKSNYYKLYYSDLKSKSKKMLLEKFSYQNVLMIKAKYKI